MHIGFVFAALVAAFVTACAIVDFRLRRIPNWLTVTAALSGLVYSAAAPNGIGILWSLAGFAVGFSLLILPWMLGGGGMGDVKMLAALGTWLGPMGILIAFGLASILAVFGMIGVLAASALNDGFSATRKRYVSAAAVPVAATGSRKVRRVLPFAVPVAMSTWLVLGWMLIKAAS
jgi:prepilin peptidase CpaA